MTDSAPQASAGVRFPPPFVYGQRYLPQRFPVEYPAYCSRVRRWL